MNWEDHMKWIAKCKNLQVSQVKIMRENIFSLNKILKTRIEKSKNPKYFFNQNYSKKLLFRWVGRKKNKYHQLTPSFRLDASAASAREFCAPHSRVLMTLHVCNLSEMHLIAV